MKNTMKRILTLLLALTLLAGLLPAWSFPASAAGDVAINASNFPDENFRNYVRQFDTDGNGTLSAPEIAGIISIDCSYCDISSLQGIEFFPRLSVLFCYGNNLTALNVSKNIELTLLLCNNNQLTKLNVSKNTDLEYLYCYGNQLTALDVSKNTALTWLLCYDNQLTELDVSKNTALTVLRCGNNQLTELDVSKNTALTELGCGYNQLTELDVSKNTTLTNLSCPSNQLTTLNVSKNTQLVQLDCYSNQLTALDISKNTFLMDLFCFSNQLTTLNVSKNTALTQLDCNFNQLTSLNVSKNTALVYLTCEVNQLAVLDVSKNTGLETLFCANNRLTELNLSKNTALVSLGCMCNQLAELDIGKNTKLEWFDCSNNQLTQLDVSKNTVLEYMYCYDNQLTALDISKNTKLKSLLCQYNQIKTLDISNNTMLENLLTNGNRNWNIFAYCCYENEDYSEEFSFDKKTKILLSDGTSFRENPFVDVSKEDWFYTPVLWAIDNDVTAGTDETHFSPELTVTRAEAMVFFWAANGRPEPQATKSPFKDVKKSHWAFKAIMWAVENGITGGTDANHFSPAQTCSRSEIIQFLYAAMGKPGYTIANPYSDVKNKHWYKDGAIWAYEMGIERGENGKFKAKTPCTRAYVVTYLYRYFTHDLLDE